MKNSTKGFCLIVPVLLVAAAVSGDEVVGSLFPIKDAHGEWGCIDREGRVIVEPKYAWGWPSKGGHIVFLDKLGDAGKFLAVDHAGRILFERDCRSLVALDHGFFSMRRDDGTRVILDRTGDVISPRPLTPQRDISGEHLIPIVNDEDRWGFMTLKGEITIPYQYDSASPFSEGFAFVLRDKHDRIAGGAFIDTQGKLLDTPPFFMSLGFHEGLAMVYSQERAGVIDRRGELVIPFMFRRAGSFHGGLAWAEDLDGRFGHINPAGEWVIPPKFEVAGDFADGVTAVKLNRRWILIARDGAVIAVLDRATSLEPFKDGLAQIRWADDWGYIDQTGHVVWRAKAGISN